MKRSKFAISFEKHFLNYLAEDESSCVEVQEHNYHLALHPFHLNNITESIKDILNQGIAKYDKKLGGILLGYQNIKLLSQSGVVANDSFFIHVDITASFFLFKPEVDKVLLGTVNKKSHDHVGCLVHKTFNVSLPKPENEDDDDWMGTKVEIGQDIMFRITFINLEARLPYIRAEFVSILGEQDSGISTSEEPVEKNLSEASKKPTRIVFESHSEDEEITEIKTTKKKKKKHRKKDESEDDVSKQENENKGKKKNKKHKHISHEEHSDPIETTKKKKHKHKHDDMSEIKETEVDNKFSDKQRFHKSTSLEYDKDQNAVGDSVSIKKKKKHKHQKELDEESNYLEVESTNKKKSKHKYDSLTELTEAKMEENQSFIKQKSHKKEKEETKSDTEDHSISKKKKKDKKQLHEKKQKNTSQNILKPSFEFKNADSNISIENTSVKKKKTSEELEDIESPSKKKNKHKNKLHQEEHLEETVSKQASFHSYDDLSEIADSTRGTKKKKKSKHKDSLADLTEAALQRALHNISGNQSKGDKKKKNKKERKSKEAADLLENDDLDTSLPELNLSTLFNETNSSKSTPKENFIMADNEDKASKKRRSSVFYAQIWENKKELEPDSDLERILQDIGKTSKHKRKDSSKDSTKLSRKRQRSTSSDDFVTPILVKKHKKNVTD